MQKKRVLSLEVTPIVVNAMLIEFEANAIKIKHQQSILLKDLTVQAQTNAIKKIISNVASFDEIIVSLASSTVVFKELTLPFLHRDALEMIVPYEAESLLPFSLEEAEIDFIITAQNIEKQESKILVAAIRKEDLQTQMSFFEKADISIDTATIDIFALFELFKNTEQSKIDATIPKMSLYQQLKNSMHQWFATTYARLFKKTTPVDTPNAHMFQPKNAYVYIDIGFDVTRVLYMQNQTLQTIRMIPVGFSDIAQNISQSTTMPYYDVMHNLIQKQSLEPLQEQLKIQINHLCEELKRTIHFFQTQEKQNYIPPEKLLFSGFLTSLPEFITHAQTNFTEPMQIVDIAAINTQLHIQTKSEFESTSILNQAVGLFSYFNAAINFLKHSIQKHDATLFNKQIISVITMTLLSLGLTFWRSQSILSSKEAAYNSSKRQCTQAIEQRMHLDLGGEKNIKTILEKAEDKLKSEKNMWASFATASQHSLLEYLQDLSVHIDKNALELHIKQMHLDYDKITMSASVKSFEALDLLEEELQELTVLQSLDKPRELSFSLQFQPKSVTKQVRS